LTGFSYSSRKRRRTERDEIESRMRIEYKCGDRKTKGERYRFAE